jgi:hypothetical protein
MSETPAEYGTATGALDREDLDPAVIRPVAMREGLTIIGEVDDASQEIVKQKLYTLGELMRGNQLSPRTSGTRPGTCGPGTGGSGRSRSWPRRSSPRFPTARLPRPLARAG